MEAEKRTGVNPVPPPAPASLPFAGLAGSNLAKQPASVTRKWSDIPEATFDVNFEYAEIAEPGETKKKSKFGRHMTKATSSHKKTTTDNKDGTTTPDDYEFDVMTVTTKDGRTRNTM